MNTSFSVSELLMLSGWLPGFPVAIFGSYLCYRAAKQDADKRSVIIALVTTGIGFFVLMSLNLWGIRFDIHDSLLDMNGKFDFAAAYLITLFSLTCAVLAALLMIPGIWVQRMKQQAIAELEENPDADPDKVL